MSDCPYDVGDILETKNSTNPSQRWPGTTWQAIETFLLGVSASHEVGSSGGEEAHMLTVEEMPSHSHEILTQAGGISNVLDGIIQRGSTGSSTSVFYESNPKGSSQPHNNMPPYTTVYIWERTV